MQGGLETGSIRSLHPQDATGSQIRGSSLLLSGRVLSLGINFAAQVLVVRFFSTADYGALAFGLGVVSLLEIFATLGLQEAVSQFVPICYESGQYEKLVGTIVLAAGAILTVGMLIVVAVQGWLAHLVTHERLAAHLLAILIFLVPIDAADALLDALFASFASTRDIFWRKYMLGPGLKFGAVLLLIWTRSTITFLAYGYLLASALGEIIYIWMFRRLLYARLPHRFRSVAVKVPWRELLAFVVPGLTSIVATAGIANINIFLLGYMRTMSDAAYYRAALPAAGLNGIVLASFTLLYTPSAARLFAKADRLGINNLYWQTAVWMSVLSFPIFAVTFSLARPFTALLYGARYEQSAPILMLLSLGSYFNVCLGFNLQTLKIFGRLRYLMLVSVLAALADVGANVLLIPRYGAIGAAIGGAGALISYNLLLQVGLVPTSNVKAFDRRYLSVYLTIVLSASSLFMIQSLTSLSFYLALPLAGLASLFVLAVAKKSLSVGEVFPEVLRLPFMRLILT
jgi:O-antigen/teichoic acid export membrane protein